MKVYAPNREYAGVSAGVQFANGVGETDNGAALAYFARAGYGIGKEPPAVPAKPRAFEPALPSTVILVPPSNDAAVQKDAGGPVSDAFLPPTNAGDAEPHGPLVVSPGIHGVNNIRPGEVYVDDVDRQEREETELAERTLVAPVEPATIVSTMGPDGDVSDARDDRPTRSATKAAWIDWAAGNGSDRDELAALTKAEIIERFETS